MRLKMTLLAAAGLMTLSACGVYQDYPNDNSAVESHRGYYQENRASGNHPSHVRARSHHMHGDHGHHDHSRYGHNHEMHHTAGHSHNAHGDVVVGQDKDSYMRQNEDKWMYNSCPPGAAKRGDC